MFNLGQCIKINHYHTRMMKSETNEQKMEKVAQQLAKMLDREHVYGIGILQSWINYHDYVNLLQVVPRLIGLSHRSSLLTSPLAQPNFLCNNYWLSPQSHLNPNHISQQLNHYFPSLGRVQQSFFHYLPRDMNAFQPPTNKKIYPKCCQSLGIIHGYFITKGGKTYSFGTGIVISSRHVITCMRLILEQDRLQKRKKNDQCIKCTQSQSIYFYLNKRQYKVGKKLIYKIPCQPMQECLTEQPVMLELEQQIEGIQFMKIGTIEDNDKDPNLFIVGYPTNNYKHQKAKNVTVEQLKVYICQLIQFNEQTKNPLKYRANTHKGTSGNPIIKKEFGQYKVCGLYTDRNNIYGSGIRFNTQTIQYINKIVQNQLKQFNFGIIQSGHQDQKLQNESVMAQFNNCQYQQQKQNYQNTSTISEFDDYYQQSSCQEKYKIECNRFVAKTRLIYMNYGFRKIKQQQDIKEDRQPSPILKTQKLSII